MTFFSGFHTFFDVAKIQLALPSQHPTIPTWNSSLWILAFPGISLWIWPAICKNPPFPATLWHLIEVPGPLHVGLEGDTDVGGVATEAKAVHHADVERPVPGGSRSTSLTKRLGKIVESWKIWGTLLFSFSHHGKVANSLFFGAIYIHTHTHTHTYTYIQLYNYTIRQLYNYTIIHIYTYTYIYI